MLSELNKYISIIEFMGDILGKNTEIILYDINDKVAIYVKNAFDEDMKIGTRIRSLEYSFLETEVYKDKDHILNYKSLSYSNSRLKSSTHFIKDNKKELIGMITVNQKVDDLLFVRDIINNMINGEEYNRVEDDSKFYEKIDISFEKLMESTIESEIAKFNLPPDRLSYDEKIDLIDKLDKKGVFLVKGSVNELAKLLNITETTIYRYIHKLNKNT